VTTTEETTSAAALAGAVKDHVSRLGGAFMLGPEARAAGKEAGLRGWQFYFLGRGGPLGGVPADVVTASFGFFPPSTVAAGWDAARATYSAAEGALRFTAVCHAWGRSHLADAPDLERLATLLHRVVTAADGAGLPLFAAWRATLDRHADVDLPARVAHLAHVAREHRGGCHLAAVLASGLTPLESVLTAGGPGNAQFFSWPEPYDDVSALVERRAAAESLTDEITGRAWVAALDERERAEVVELLAAARAAADAADAVPA
jgi:hypothetical protein